MVHSPVSVANSDRDLAGRFAALGNRIATRGVLGNALGCAPVRFIHGIGAAAFEGEHHLAVLAIALAALGHCAAFGSSFAVRAGHVAVTDIARRLA